MHSSKHTRSLALLLAASIAISLCSACRSKSTGDEASDSSGLQGDSLKGDQQGNPQNSSLADSSYASFSPDSTSLEEPEFSEDVEVLHAVFLGVKDYGQSQTNKDNAESFRYRFSIDGVEKIFAIDNSELDSSGHPAYPVQNTLKEGYSFKIYVKDDTILRAIELTSDSSVTANPASTDSPDSSASQTPGSSTTQAPGGSAYHAPVTATPGERTVLNFLKTALLPVGTALYVFGGGWDWQDTGSATQARTIGVSPDWVKFFNEHNENYTFREVDGDKEKADPTTSYYPYGGYNEYYYAGLDCSGFVGWTIYNTFETENGRPGYVGYATKMAKRFSQENGWGTYTQNLTPAAMHAPAQNPSAISPVSSDYTLLPGDIVSIKGHVWISFGTCADGSILIVHSTNGNSRTGQPGCGVTLGAIGTSQSCEAYVLADTYMSRYYPEWYRRYSVPLSSPDKYLTIEGDDAGLFSWNTSVPASSDSTTASDSTTVSGSTAISGLTDDANIRNLTPAEILKLCYGE